MASLWSVALYALTFSRYCPYSSGYCSPRVGEFIPTLSGFVQSEQDARETAATAKIIFLKIAISLQATLIFLGPPYIGTHVVRSAEH